MSTSGGLWSTMAIVAEDGGGGGSFVGGCYPCCLCLIACVHLRAGVLVCGHLSVGTSLLLSVYLPHCWQQHGTWEASSEGEGAFESMVGAVYSPVAENSQTVTMYHVITVRQRVVMSCRPCLGFFGW